MGIYVDAIGYEFFVVDESLGVLDWFLTEDDAEAFIASGQAARVVAGWEVGDGE